MAHVGQELGLQAGELHGGIAGLLHFFGGQLAVRDIQFDRHEVGDLPVRVLDRGDGGVFPEKLPALFAVEEFAFPDAAGENGVPEFLVQALGIFPGVEDLGILSHELQLRVAGQLEELRVGVLNIPVAVGDQYGSGAGFDGRRQLAHLQLRMLAHRDVGGQAQEAGQVVVMVQQRRHGQLDREAGAVLLDVGPLLPFVAAAPGQSHEDLEALYRLLELRAELLSVGGHLGRQVEDLGGFAQDFSGPVAQHLFGAGAEHGDGPGEVGGDNGKLGGRIQDALQPQLEVSQPVLGQPALADRA